MVLLLDWSNLGAVALPVFASLTAAGLLAMALGRAAQRGGLPRAREPCVRCRFERQLLAHGACREACAVNALPTLPLVLFVAATTFAFLSYFFPESLETYVLPFAPEQPSYGVVLVALTGVVSAAAAVALAAYFAQDLPAYRDVFNFGAASAVLAGVVVGSAAPSPALVEAGSVVAPLALFALLLGLAAEARARQGRPAFGLRAIAMATAPLFLVTVLALGRILEILELAAAAH